MKHAAWIALPLLLATAACSDRSEPEELQRLTAAEPDGAPQNKFGFKEAQEQSLFVGPDWQGQARSAALTAASTASQAAEAAASDAPPVQQAAATAPRIAYAYTYGFDVSAENLQVLQRKHAELCEKMGPQSCRVMEMSESGSHGYASGRLELEVAAPRAKGFGTELINAAAGTGAEQTSSAVSGEDLTKRIIDTEARLKSKLVLRDRLLGLLARHNGSVAELIEAERGVAAVNEEIDEAQRTLKEMNGRIEFSRVSIDYDNTSASATGFFEPIRAVLDSFGAILGFIIACLIVITIAILPVTLFAMAWRWAWRRGRALLQRFSGPAQPAAAVEDQP